MRSFKDKTGQEWLVELTLGAALEFDRANKALLKANDVVLMEMNPAHLERIASDKRLLAFLLWCCVHEEAESKGINQDAFVGRLNAKSFEEAIEVMALEFGDFFPEWATSFHKLREHYKRLQGVVQAAQELDQILEKTEQQAREMVAKGLKEFMQHGDQSGSGQESSKSIPAPSA